MWSEKQKNVDIKVEKITRRQNTGRKKWISLLLSNVELV